MVEPRLVPMVLIVLRDGLARDLPTLALRDARKLAFPTKVHEAGPYIYIVCAWHICIVVARSCTLAMVCADIMSGFSPCYAKLCSLS